jgi:hypothetical protein
MRYLRLALVPLLLAACDRQPAAPDIVAPPTLSAVQGWQEFVFEYPDEGINFGPVPCLPGAPDAVAFGSVTARLHLVTTPDGRTATRWSNPEISEDFRLQIAGDTWLKWHWVRHGKMVEDEDGNLLFDHGVEAIATFRNQRTGEVLNWPFKWHFNTTGQGGTGVEFLKEWCEVR